MYLQSTRLKSSIQIFHIMKRSLLLLFALPFLLFSCIGEDVINEDIPSGPRNLEVQGALFSLALDETNDEFLRVRTNFDSRDDVTVIWKSLDESLVTIDDNQLLRPVASESNLRKKAEITAGVYRNEDVIQTANTSTEAKFITKEGVEPIAILKEPISFFIANVSITEIQKRDRGLTDETEGLEAVINGFPETLEFIETVTSLDVADDDIPSFRAQFTNFKLQESDVNVIWTSSNEDILSLTEAGKPTAVSKGVVTVTATVQASDTNLSEEITITKELEVSDTTVIVVAPNPEPEPQIVATGDFEGLTGYSAEGGFEIIEEEGQATLLEFSDNFDSGSVPDLVLYLSNSLRTNAGALFISETVSNNGGQVFTLPENTNIGDYQYVYLYCRAFNVPVGFAMINR